MCRWLPLVAVVAVAIAVNRIPTARGPEAARRAPRGAAETARWPVQAEDADPANERRLGVHRRRDHAPGRSDDTGHPVSLAGLEHPNTLVTSNSRTITNSINLWRARCGESRTPGSEGRPEKRTGRKAGTALRSDPYSDRPQPEPRELSLAIVSNISRQS
jgi:hypothetical protein